MTALFCVGWFTHSGPESGWWGTVLPGLTGAVPHHLTVDGAADTVVQLHVELGQNVGCRVKRPEVRPCSWNRKLYTCRWKTKINIDSQSKTLASEMSLTAAASTMFLMTNFLMALSLGTQRAQLVQRMGCTCPRPFLARPLFLLFLVCINKKGQFSTNKSNRSLLFTYCFAILTITGKKMTYFQKTQSRL